MIRKAIGWLVSKTKEVIELTDKKMTMEIETAVNRHQQKGVIIISIRKNVGNFYRPYIDCLEKSISKPNYFESLVGMTFEQKIERARMKLCRKAIKRIEKGLTRERDILNENRRRRDEFFANAA